MVFAQAEQVVQCGAAAVGPVLDVVQVGPAGLTAREPAPAGVPFAGRAAQRRVGAAPPPAQVQDVPGAVVQHPAPPGRAPGQLRGAHRDGRAVLDVAPRRVSRVTRGGPGRRGGRGVSAETPAAPPAGPAGRAGGGDGAGADVHDDLVHLRVIRAGHLPGQERLSDRHQRVGQARGRRRPAAARSAAARCSAACRPRRRPPRARSLRPAGPAGRVLQVPGRRAQCFAAAPPRPAAAAGTCPPATRRPRTATPAAAGPAPGVISRADLPVRPGEPLQLIPGHRPGELRQPRLGTRRRDPGQRPHLRIRQPARGELPADHRQVPQRPRHPDVLPGRPRGHLALPRQPLRAAVHLPARPAAAGIEIPEQDQEPARRRGQVPGQLADLRLQPLQRHRVSPVSSGLGHRTVGAGARLQYIEHVFDTNRQVRQSGVLPRLRYSALRRACPPAPCRASARSSGSRSGCRGRPRACDLISWAVNTDTLCGGGLRRR